MSGGGCCRRSRRSCCRRKRSIKSSVTVCIRSSSARSSFHADVSAGRERVCVCACASKRNPNEISALAQVDAKFCTFFAGKKKKETYFKHTHAISQRFVCHTPNGLHMRTPAQQQWGWHFVSGVLHILHRYGVSGSLPPLSSHGILTHLPELKHSSSAHFVNTCETHFTQFSSHCPN